MKTIKNNQHGFTLIELLAIIVILAVIMAIAIPQVLNVVNGSKDSAWKDNIKMITKAIELNTQLYDAETGGYTYTITGLCATPSTVNEISKSSDTTVTCRNSVFTVTGTGQFDGKSATIDCSRGNCSATFTDGGDVGSTIATCSGQECRYLYTTASYRYGADGSTLAASDTKANYTEVISQSGKQYFLGVILSDGDHGKIERAFACGIRNGNPFCIEGSTDGSTYATTKNTLRKFYSRDYIDLGSDGDLDEFVNALVSKGYISSASEITSGKDLDTKADGICFEEYNGSDVLCSGSGVDAVADDYGCVDVQGDDGHCSVYDSGYLDCIG